MLRPYELVMVVSPEVQDDAISSVLERVTRFITDNGGNVETQDLWGKRRLAYPIGRFREGQYVLTHFQLEPSGTAGLDSQLKINEEILRHLIVRRDQ